MNDEGRRAFLRAMSWKMGSKIRIIAVYSLLNRETIIGDALAHDYAHHHFTMGIFFAMENLPPARKLAQF